MKASFAPIPATYGFNDDRGLEASNRICSGRKPRCPTRCRRASKIFIVRLTAGTSVDADRFSAYRLGGYLPLVAEFPLSLPGYYFQEFSARNFALINANYLLPLDRSQRWNLVATRPRPSWIICPARAGRQLAQRRGRRHYVSLAIRPVQNHARLRLRH